MPLRSLTLGRGPTGDRGGPGAAGHIRRSAAPVSGVSFVLLSSVPPTPPPTPSPEERGGGTGSLTFSRIDCTHAY